MTSLLISPNHAPNPYNQYTLSSEVQENRIEWDLDYDFMVRYSSIMLIQSFIRGFLVRNRKVSGKNGLNCVIFNPSSSKKNCNRIFSLRKRRRMSEIIQGGDGDPRLFANNLEQEDSIESRKKVKSRLVNGYNNREKKIKGARRLCRLSKSSIF